MQVGLVTGREHATDLISSSLPEDITFTLISPDEALTAPDWMGELSSIFIDATSHVYADNRSICRYIAGHYPTVPIGIFIALEDFGQVDRLWAIDEMLTPDAPTVEIETRLKLLTQRTPVPVEPAGESPVWTTGDLVLNTENYTAHLNGEPLDLTCKEFELLSYLVRNSHHVFTREQLLRDVWGYDYFGGTRTVDVHIRRLRAKLGQDHQDMIGTVRNVGYQLQY